MNATHPTAQFLRRHRWRARGTLLVWSLGVTLTTAAFFGAVHLGWTQRGLEWALAPIALATLLLVAWFRRASRLTARQLAHELDQRWELRARLETAVELAANESPLAQEQRNDATKQLAGKRAPGALLWFTGWLAIATVLSLLSVEGIAIAIQSMRKPPPPKAAAAPQPETPAATPPPPAPPEFHAAIQWQSPDSEIKATAIEEVPLVATAESNTGFRSLTLEMVVNGDRELSRPLEDAMITPNATTGALELTPSLYLDELEVKVGDIVSYRLVGELKTEEKRMVTSPLQFVEIRATQRDRKLRGGPMSPIAALILELKSRQLELLKQNFSLAQTAASDPDAAWIEENTRVANDQESLSPRAGELVKLIRAVPGAPAVIVDKAKEVQSLTHEAAEGIAAKANEGATKPQGRALAILGDLSTLIQQALSGPPGPVTDPFQDKQTFKLTPRSETPAGQLEQLAEAQEKNNAQLGGSPAAGTASSSGAAGSGNSGDTKAVQATIAQAAQKLAASAALDPAAQEALTEGGNAAADAAQQLSLNDVTAARVPAATALRGFQDAIAAQDKAGRATAAAELEQIRRALNAASRGSAGERAQQIAKARDALRAAANEQQRTGSADAAREFAQLSELANSAQPTPERAREIAAAAAQVQVALMPRPAAVGRAVRLLSRSGQPGTSNGTGGMAGDLEMAAQEAQWLSSDAPTIELARKVSTQTDASLRSGAGKPAIPPETLENATKLAAALERGLGGRNELVRRFNPADVDPAYRGAVETYFERLSREARPAPRPVEK
jgi:hypothetical protein